MEAQDEAVNLLGFYHYLQVQHYRTIANRLVLQMGDFYNQELMMGQPKGKKITFLSKKQAKKHEQIRSGDATEENDDSVDDEAVSDFVHRVLLSATMNDNDEDTFGISRSDDGFPKKPSFLNQPKKKVVKLENLVKEKSKKSPSKLDRKIKRVKNGQSSSEELIYVAEEVPVGSTQVPPSMPPGPSICVPLYTYRRMVDAETSALGRQMEEYYNGLLGKVSDEKNGALRSLVYWQDRCKKIEQECDFFADESRHLRTLTDHLNTEIVSLKEAKRRRRTAKKQRNRLVVNQAASCTADIRRKSTKDAGRTEVNGQASSDDDTE